MSQARIFVSHSHQDNEWCRLFVEALKAVGYDVWYDETGLTGGDAWVAKIEQEVQTRDGFFLVLTPEAWASPWVQKELKLAFATDRRIMPLLLRNTTVDGFLLTTQWITIIDEEPRAAARAAIHAFEAPPAPGRNAVPVSKENLDDLILLCKTLATDKRYTEVLSICERALALDPDNIDVLCVKVAVLDLVGEDKQAVPICIHLLPLLSAQQDYFAANIYAYYVVNHSDTYTASNPDDVKSLIHAFQAIRGIEERLNRVNSRNIYSGMFGRVEADDLGPFQAAGYLSLFKKHASAWRSRYSYSSGVTYEFLSLVIANLVKVEAHETIAELVKEFDALGEGEQATVALAKAGQVSAVMQRAANAQVFRAPILDALSVQEQYGAVDRLSNEWFGRSWSSFGRLRATSSDIQSLAYWVNALAKLGRQKEADAIESVRKRLEGHSYD